MAGFSQRGCICEDRNSSNLRRSGCGRRPLQKRRTLYPDRVGLRRVGDESCANVQHFASRNSVLRSAYLPLPQGASRVYDSLALERRKSKSCQPMPPAQHLPSPIHHKCNPEKDPLTLQKSRSNSGTRKTTVSWYRRDGSGRERRERCLKPDSSARMASSR